MRKNQVASGRRGARALTSVAVLVAMIGVGGAVGAPAALAAAGDISTVAGTGANGAGGDLGPATSAQLNYPFAVALDAAGNLYIADEFNHRVRKVDTSGTITTFAGNGSDGFNGDDVPATSAQLNYPTGVAVDSASNVYIVDGGNHRVRKVDATSGVITTVAGTGTAGYNGDAILATDAELNYPSVATFDSAGNLYIADELNQRIRKVTSSGVISTVAGDGTSSGDIGDGGAATSARLNNPEGLVVDNAGNLYISDTFHHRVRRVNTLGIITTVAGTGTAGFSGDGVPATSAALNFPEAVLLDGAGNLFLADNVNHRVRKVNAAGTITTVAGDGTAGSGGDGGAATLAQLDQPVGLALSDAGDVYVSDHTAHRVRLLSGVAAAATGALTVNSVADPGVGTCDVVECTLREAITAANATPGSAIHFAISGAGVHTIQPTTDLPALTRPTTTLDATTQPGYAGAPLVELDGSLVAGSGASKIGLQVYASDSTIAGLAVNRFANRGILVGQGTSRTTLRANYVGTNAAGSAALGSFTYQAIEVAGDSNVVGGPTSADRNVVAGGLQVNNYTASGASGNKVEGNHIGINAAGTASLGGQFGLWIAKSTNTAVTGNVISGLTSGNGVQVDINTVGAVFHGNLIGTNAAGTAAVPNSAGLLVNGPGTVIGGSAAGEGNVVSGNTGDGIRLDTDHAVVSGNRIGLGSGGEAVGNGQSGVSLIGTTSHDNLVGGTTSGAGNTIANNGRDGISVFNGAGQTIEGNSIFANTRLGIDLVGDGVTANDAGDGDTGQNNLQNFPVLTAAESGTPGVVRGTLDSGAGSYRIELFTSTACDGSGNGEGTTYLGSVTATSGTPFSYAADLSDGMVVTATATAPDGSTSEFSACRTAQAPAAQYALTVAKDGSGSGSVASSPAGISCGATCSASFDSGTSVTLTATPAAGSSFTGWSGSGCSGTGTCVVTMTAAQSVAATFSPVQYVLTVTKSGSGSGTVASSPAGISCGATCSASFDSGTSVTLTATPSAGSSFTGWSGSGCTGTGTCVVTMTAAQSVAATFSPVQYVLTVTKSGSGSGTVASSPAGISCGATCSASFDSGTSVTLTATPSAGSSFTGWSGSGCTGTGTCVVTMTAAQSVAATFSPVQYVLTVTKSGSGSGTVASSPAGISCGATCSASFDSGTSVTLTATPSAGSSFTGWSGSGCTGTGTCVVTMTAAQSVAATFSPVQYVLTVTKSGSGSGTVASSPAGISCGATCSASFNSGTSVTLTATPSAGSSFTGWSGSGCTGTGTCVVTMTAAQAVTATFGPASTSYVLSVTKEGSGSGFVSSSPAGISCGTTCSATFNAGTVVTLTVNPDPTTAFAGWSGACTGTGSCVVTMSEARSVKATLIIKVAAIAAGYSHTCTVQKGAVKCWGRNDAGQLGDGTTVDRDSPALVAGLSSGVTSISSGDDFTCAVQRGAVKCWGTNSAGQLGDGTTVDRRTPVTVTGLTSGVTAVSAGRFHACAIQYGAAKCWGDNRFGELGDGTGINRLTPVAVFGLSSGVSAVVASIGGQSCAIHNGAAKCWGINRAGELGDGTTLDRNKPVVVNGLKSSVTGITAGYRHTCAVHGGAAKCWGANEYGQLGDGTRTARLTPVLVSGLGSGVTSVTGGGFHTCAVRLGASKCWGDNESGQLGDGTDVTSSGSAVTSLGLSANVSVVEAGIYSSCALQRNVVLCWGQGGTSRPVVVAGL